MNDFKREYNILHKKIGENLQDFFNSGYYILGNKVAEFERNFANYIGTKYCIGVANGLEALQISLLALGIGEGDEVITTANSAVATALAITNVQAKPVFVDIDDFFHIDATKIEEKITTKTKAIIPVHLYGQMADIQTINKVAKKYKLKVIEDACQAHGASFSGKKAGSFGILGCFSFYPTKNLGGYGDGGAIVTNSYSLYKKCLMLRNYGQADRYKHLIKGLNSRLDELQAWLLNFKLKSLNSLNNRRNKIAKIYFENLKNITQIKLPKVRSGHYHVFHLFVLRAKNRNNLQSFLKTNNIQTLIHYPIPIHKQVAFAESRNVLLKQTDGYSREILSLPIHPYMTDQEALKVCLAIKKFYER